MDEPSVSPVGAAMRRAGLFFLQAPHVHQGGSILSIPSIRSIQSTILARLFFSPIMKIMLTLIIVKVQQSRAIAEGTALLVLFSLPAPQLSRCEAHWPAVAAFPST
ncbi:hypothetical protein [Desulfomicrobium escambiense]|uniref:hypothetical protein n=1 Tax=Desulfomicrobium escambiense TaxID=29503 RepID=UPI000490F705|nr:hypothetical protein [Desulfomicrobium escambiense]